MAQLGAPPPGWQEELARAMVGAQQRQMLQPPKPVSPGAEQVAKALMGGSMGHPSRPHSAPQVPDSFSYGFGSGPLNIQKWERNMRKAPESTVPGVDDNIPAIKQDRGATMDQMVDELGRAVGAMKGGRDYTPGIRGVAGDEYQPFDLADVILEMAEGGDRGSYDPETIHQLLDEYNRTVGPDERVDLRRLGL